MARGSALNRALRRFPVQLAAIALVCGACRPQTGAGQYIVTATPVNLGIGSGRFCVAVQPDDPQGVWWWEPGPTDCSTRSTGPGVFHAERASVSPASQGSTARVRFRIQLKRAPGSSEPPFVDIELVLAGDFMEATSTHSRAAIVRRNDLEIPERWR